MSLFAQKRTKIILASIGGLLVLGALLWYYQQQGFIKILPTGEEREIKKILEIDRTKFVPAEGLSQEKFEEEIAKLQGLKVRVLENLTDADAWFDFAYSKDFLNDHEGAVLAWEKSWKFQPLNFVTAMNLGTTYQYFLKDWDKAEFYYGKALELRPDLTQAYQGLLDLYRFNWPNKKNHVEPLLLEAIKNDSPNQLPYYVALVEFFAREGDISKAKIYLQNVRALDESQAGPLLEDYPALK